MIPASLVYIALLRSITEHRPVACTPVVEWRGGLKRGIHGVYHQVSAKHLGRYVDEFTFRLNQGDTSCFMQAQSLRKFLFGSIFSGIGGVDLARGEVESGRDAGRA